MAARTPPGVFVSSTCYDLKQIRRDLRDFIESYGFEAILSEYDSFPVDPDLSTVENCLKAVDDRADIFLLIVGGRYGSRTTTGKSVTNQEYARARFKRVPLYVFVASAVLNTLPIWKANPGASFEAVVDSPMVLEFVSALKESGDVWVFPFETAQDIATTLRKQWAYLFRDALELRTRARSLGLPESLSSLHGVPLQLVIERPIAWEHRLFSQILSEELEAAKPMKRDVEYEIAFAESGSLQELETLAWASKKLTGLLRIVDSVSRLINVAFPKAIGPPGVAEDPVEIVYVARRIIEGYRRVLEWATDFRCIQVPERAQRFVDLTSEFSSGVIHGIEEFVARLEGELQTFLSEPRTPGVPRIIEVTLKLAIADTKEIEEELNRLRVEWGIS